MNDTQSNLSLLLIAINSIAAAVAAYYGFRNHQVGAANSAKIDAVQVAQDGTTHTLAGNLAIEQAKNSDLIRTLAASTIPATPPPEAP